jgi:predicted NUDIX family NTP pyrophosphohydrolase
MPLKSAGILFYRFENKVLQVLLVHPGGPYWIGKEKGAWSIPKGEFQNDEDPLHAAKRETFEEIGINIDALPNTLSSLILLKPVKQKSGKIILAWAAKADVNISKIKSNDFEIEWPPKSGKRKSFPEVDQAKWMDLEEAKEKINPGQLPLISELEEMIANH